MRKTTKGGAGMIGGIRSPMATPAHGLVAKEAKLNPSIAANTTRPGISKSSAPIRSPQNAGNIVKY